MPPERPAFRGPAPKAVWLKLPAGLSVPETLAGIDELVSFYPGDRAVKVFIEETREVKGMKRLVSFEHAFVLEAEALLGEGSVREGE